MTVKKVATLYRKQLFDELAFWFKKNLGRHLQKYLYFFSKTVFDYIPYSEALCKILDGEQAYNFLFNLVQLARAKIQKVDPICENLFLPPAQLSFGEY